MKKILAAIVSVILLLMVSAGFSLAESANEPASAGTLSAEYSDVQYVLYLGTNDKDTNKPVFTEAEAMEKASWFLDGGRVIEQKHYKKLIDWTDDEHLIFPAVNKVAGTETRALPFLHWWTFLGYFNEIGENSLFASVLSIRSKKAKGKKLEKYEQEFYKENKDIIDLKTKYTEEEKAEIERLKELLG